MPTPRRIPLVLFSSRLTSSWAIRHLVRKFASLGISFSFFPVVRQVYRNRHLSAADFTWQCAGEEMGNAMSVVSSVVVQPLPGVEIGDFFAVLKSMQERLSTLDAVDSVQVGVITIGGPSTNSFAVAITSADWEAFGKAQAAVYTDPEWAAALIEAGKVATWQTFASQDIDWGLLPS
jgi:hypothetical protein